MHSTSTHCLTAHLQLLAAAAPKGLLLLSGDVHIGELLSASGGVDALEITSSGLTHDCTDGAIPRCCG
jgi:hypothetical protein